MPFLECKLRRLQKQQGKGINAKWYSGIMSRFTKPLVNCLCHKILVVNNLRDKTYRLKADETSIYHCEVFFFT